ncbi:MAG: putative sulfate exporter family transporter [Acidimicrobiia bacterium]|nr:putative sulfate exporter family transporter [Acidimicrobiia bacterium]MDQ3500394.1 putative sulfate exporter family transporter [Actinomycetota bacterium]
MPTFASPLFLAVFGGVIIGNLLPRGSRLQPGFRFAATWLLRIGVVLLGLRISLSDLLSIGAKGLLVVVITVAVTFLGAQWLGRRLGVRPDLALLVGTGYAICGVSAVTAMNGVIRADEEEAAYAIGLVTLAGSLSIVILPIFGQVLGLDPSEFGTWVGGAVHDVAQTIATASTSTEVATESAIVTKLSRVALLAPIILAVTIRRRRQELEGIPNRRPPILPWFVVGFLAFVALRSTGWLNEDIIGTVRAVEGWLFVIALVGVGAGVDISRLRQLGGRPLQLGMLTWVLVAGISYLGVVLVN